MNAKSIALLIVGMMIISSVFVFFHVDYPANPAKLVIHFQPPKNAKLPNLTQIFQNQTPNYPGLYLNRTSFTSAGNTSVVLEGYAYNSTSNLPIANQRLGVFVEYVFGYTTTNSKGFYRMTILQSGTGTFAFSVLGYNPLFQKLFISSTPGSTMWRNLSFNPADKYKVSGLTESYGHPIGNVNISMDTLLGNYTTQSSSTGSYGLSMTNGTYLILVNKTGFFKFPTPYTINVTGAPISDYNLNLTVNKSSPAYYISGYVFNDLGKPIAGAEVYSKTLNVITHTDAAGYYNITATFYTNTLIFSDISYYSLTQAIMVLHNVTDYNVNLASKNPFLLSPNTGNVTTSLPNGMSKNSSAVNYASPVPLVLSGQIKLYSLDRVIPNSQFYIYTSVNGSSFYDSIATNNNGNYTIEVSYKGNYNFTIVSSIFSQTYKNISLTSSRSNIPIYVNTSLLNIFTLKGYVLNALNNSLSVRGATVYLSANGVNLATATSSSNGSYSFMALKGNYTLTVSAPGYLSNTSSLSLNSNVSNYNLNLTPASNSVSGGTVWSPGGVSGVPGISPGNITGLMNSTQGSLPPPSTSNSSSFNLTMKFENSSDNKTINNTAFLVYVKVDGQYFRAHGTTNGSGEYVMKFRYGGTYIIVPEMVQYSGPGLYVNTSHVSQPLVVKMSLLQLYNLNLNLSNPFGIYNGSKIPTGGLVSYGYLLPIVSYSNYMGANYTLVNYSLPNGTYNFNYTNVNFVFKEFTSNISGNQNRTNETIDPYTLNLTWNTSASWGYKISGTSPLDSNKSKNPGQGHEIFALTAGPFTLDTYLLNYSTSSKVNDTTFNLNATNFNKTLNFVISLSSHSINSINVNYNSTTDVLTYTYSIPSNIQTWYLSQFHVNVTLTKNTNLTIQSNTNVPYNNQYFNLTNYFATSSITTTGLLITSNNYTSIIYPKTELTVSYYTTTLK